MQSEHGSSDNEGEMDHVIGALTIIAQVIGVIKLIEPLVKVGVTYITQRLRNVHIARILRHMKAYHERNCKLRLLAYKVTDSVIDLVQHEPGGYTFWHMLHRTGHHSKSKVRKKICDRLLSNFFTDEFLTMLIQASVVDGGKPNGPLYTWLVDNVYSGDVQKFYKDWLEVKGEVG